MEQEKEKKRKHVFKHKNYLEAVANSLHKTNPTELIIYNTLLGVYETAFSEGYQTRIEDSAYFKSKKNARQRTSWDTIKDSIDDIVHPQKS